MVTFNDIYDAGLTGPLIVSTFFWCTVKYFQPSKETVLKNKLKAKQSGKKKSKTFQVTPINLIILFYNATLCIFSGLCFLNTFPIIMKTFLQFGWSKGLCNIQNQFYNDDGTYQKWGYWSWLFVLSKYYEIVDSYIVIYKERRPITLQVYHHIGAMIVFSWFHYDSGIGSFIFMVPNSFIHTIMYFYYGMSTLKINIPWKSSITVMQLIQLSFMLFVVCYSLIYLYPTCVTNSGKYSLYFMWCYLVWLIYMFSVFYIDTYNKKPITKKPASPTKKID